MIKSLHQSISVTLENELVQISTQAKSQNSYFEILMQMAHKVS